MQNNRDIRPQLGELMERVNQNNLEYINSLFQELRLHFYEAYQHSSQVAMWSGIIAYQCGMTKENVDRVCLAALLHDIGKLNVPKEVLEKEEKLTAEEFMQIKKHPNAGFLLIKDYVPAQVAYAVLMHHERIDGSGYPYQLEAENIPEYAKIIMVADAFAAMIVDRVYRPAMSWESAIAELRRQSRQYDRKCVQALEYAIGYDLEVVNK